MLNLLDDFVKENSFTKRIERRKKEIREEIFHDTLKRVFVEKQPTEAKKALAAIIVGF
ncbi:MAG: hypothetical protein WC587_01035 [Candidatus Paceibacterota bacterium]